MTYRSESRPERGRIEQGIGCASIAAAAFIGFVGLADYAGPTGWRGLSEFLGWTVVCVASGLGAGSLLGHWRRGGGAGYAAVLLAVVGVALLTYAVSWLGLDAPMTAKALFTTTLQIVGTFGITIWLGYAAWAQFRN